MQIIRFLGLGVAQLCCGLLVTSFSFQFAQTTKAAVLTHRYAFDTNAGDSIGNGNGILNGDAIVTNGMLQLDGTSGSVQLPDDLLTNYNSVSFELWYADQPGSSPSNQLYDFSGSLGAVKFYLDGRGSLIVNGKENSVALPVPAVGGTNHLIWVENTASQTARIYINGVLAAQNTGFSNAPALIGSTTNNLIGAGATDQLTSCFRGDILEFRIYQGSVSSLDAAMLDAFGPDHPQINPGTPLALRLEMPSAPGPGALIRPTIFANYSNVTNVNISTLSDLVLSSDNTNVIAVTPDQHLETLTLGTATISAQWQGLTTSMMVSVSRPQDVALIHRYSFNEQTNDWIVHDSVGGANGRLFNTGSFSPTNAVFSGHGEMRLSGGYLHANTTGGYAALPPGIISSLSEVTVEAWVNWTPKTSIFQYGYMAWQRIFDFGSQSGSQGVSYLFLTPATDNISFTTKPLLHTAITTNLNINETPRLNWTNKFPINVLSQVVVAYSPVRGVMKMYVDGELAASGTATIPLSGIVDTNCWLGKSLFSADAYFYGSFDEFRIYRGLLSDADIAADYAAGPDAVGSDFVLHGFDAGSSNAMVLTWGLTATNLELQTSSTLGKGANWIPVSDPAVLTNGRYTVRLPATNPEAFYRLHSF